MSNQKHLGNVSQKHTFHHTSARQGWQKARKLCAALAVLVLTGSIMPVAFAADKDIIMDGGKARYDISPANTGTNIAIGKNSEFFIGGGTQESIMSFGEKVSEGFFSYNIHDNAAAKENLPAAIAVGANVSARTGSIFIGDHTLEKNKIAIGDTKAGEMASLGVATTNVGTNSYTNGVFATTYGSYNVQSSQYNGSGGLNTLLNATKNAFSTVVGTFNSNESISGGATAGVANVITGTANKITNSNGSIVMGAGNTVKNSSDSFDASAYMSPSTSVTDMQNKMIQGVRNSSGGAALVIGGGNEVTGSTYSQFMGVNNKSENDTYTFLDGYKNTSSGSSNASVLGSNNKITDVTLTQLLGDNRTLDTVENSVIIGSAGDALTTSASDVTILGFNANVSENGGVALGYKSLATTAAGVAGYVPTGVTKSGPDYVWASTEGAVSVGDANNGITRQITGVAAGTELTDAVNVAQLQSATINLVAGNGISLDKSTGANGTTYTINTLFKDSGSDSVTFDASTKTDSGSSGTATGTAAATTTKGAAAVIETKLADDSGNTTILSKDGKLGIKGDNQNITTTASGSNLKVSLNKDIKVDSVTINNGPTINNNGMDMHNTSITNVKNGNVAPGSKDAINGGQFYNLSERVNGLGHRVDKVGAGAAALAALHPGEFNPEDKWDFSVGYGNYRSANAVALGAFYHPNAATFVSVGTTLGDNNNMFNAGVTFKIGQGNSAQTYAKNEADRVVMELRQELAQVKADRAAQQQEIETMKAQIQQLMAKQ